MRFLKNGTFAGAAAAIVSVVLGTALGAQAPTAPAAPRQAGTIKSATATSLTLTTAAGQDVTVSLPDSAKVMVVPPGAKDLKSATAGAVTDIAVGDKTIVTGTAGDTGATMIATRVILMKSAAIAESHAAEDAAWTKGGGGLVKSVDAGTGTIVVSSGLKTLTVMTTPATVVRRYSGDSVRFADATTSSIGTIQPGDQLRVRGAKSADGSSITADEMVAGTFRNYSGLISAVDATAGTITLKDLTTKKTVTVNVTANSDVRRIPPAMAQMVAARMRGGAAGAGAQGAGGQGAPGAGAPPAGGGAAGGGEGGDASRRAAGRAGADLSQMLSRLPTETLGGLKVGDAVMIVATSSSGDAAKSSAITLLAGVDTILTAQPAGQAATLSPWSLGGGGEGGGEGGGGGPL